MRAELRLHLRKLLGCHLSCHSDRAPAGTRVHDNGLVNLVISIGPRKIPPTTAHATPTTTTAPTTTTTTVPTTAGTTAQTSFGALLSVSLVPMAASASSTTSPASTTTTLPPSNKDSLPYLNAELKALDSTYAAAAARLLSLNQAAHGLGSDLHPAGPVGLPPSRAKPFRSVLFAHRSIRLGTGLAVGLHSRRPHCVAHGRPGQEIKKGGPSRRGVRPSHPRRGPEARTSRYPGRQDVALPNSKGKRKTRKGPTFVPEVASPYVALVDEPASMIAGGLPASAGCGHVHTELDCVQGQRERTGIRLGPSGNGYSSSDGQHAPGTVNDDGEARSSWWSRAELEPTRSEVVANLAAAYTEAGQRALVVTTTDVRAEGSRRRGLAMADRLASPPRLPSAGLRRPIPAPSFLNNLLDPDRSPCRLTLAIGFPWLAASVGRGRCASGRGAAEVEREKWVEGVGSYQRNRCRDALIAIAELHGAGTASGPRIRLWRGPGRTPRLRRRQARHDLRPGRRSPRPPRRARGWPLTVPGACWPSLGGEFFRVRFFLAALGARSARC